VNAYSITCDLAACLCAELTKDGAAGPDLCFCGVLPGEIVVADVGAEENCDNGCGMAWTRIVSAYPAQTVGEVAVEPNTCGANLGVDIEVGILRCYQLPDNGDPPSPEVLAAAAARQADDMMSMYRAVKCCEALQEFGIDYLLGIFTPSGPLGGVVGGTWTLSVIF
jgi:hypothetical protein